MSDDLISRQAAIKELREMAIALYGYDATSVISCAIYKLQNLPSAEQNRIARETAGKSPDEIYEFLHWLMSDYGMQFTDTRAAVIEWLKEE